MFDNILCILDKSSKNYSISCPQVAPWVFWHFPLNFWTATSSSNVQVWKEIKRARAVNCNFQRPHALGLPSSGRRVCYRRRSELPRPFLVDTVLASLFNMCAKDKRSGPPPPLHAQQNFASMNNQVFFNVLQYILIFSMFSSEALLNQYMESGFLMFFQMISSGFILELDVVQLCETLMIMLSH